MKLYEVRYEDGTEKRVRFRTHADALAYAERLALELGMKVHVYPVWYPPNPYKKIFKK